jgi:hypothetical protein
MTLSSWKTALTTLAFELHTVSALQSFANSGVKEIPIHVSGPCFFPNSNYVVVFM